MSQIIFKNNTKEAVRLAMYKKYDAQPDLRTIAWQSFAVSPNGGKYTVTIPESYEAYASYSPDGVDRENPYAGNHTGRIAFTENTAHFLIDGVEDQDGAFDVPAISQVFTHMVVNQVRMDNNCKTAVWSHVTQGGTEIFAPRLISPKGHRTEDLRATFYVAVIADFVSIGSRMVDAEFCCPEVAVRDGQTVTLSGSRHEGYEVTASSDPT
jgi:hypothetical protein